MIAAHIHRASAFLVVIFALGACGTAVGPDPIPAPPEFVPAGGSFDTGQWVSISSEDGAVYFSADPDAPVLEFERIEDGIFVEDDAVLRAVTINAAGVRSTVAEATFEIDDPDPDAPIVSQNGIHQSNTTYYGFDITWDASPPDPAAGVEGNPHDAVTDWYDLEFAVFAGPNRDVAGLSWAQVYGTVVKDWHSQPPEGFAPIRYQTSTTGETAFVSVFVRDAQKNVTGYGAVEMTSKVALDFYVGGPGIFDRTYLHSTLDEFNPFFLSEPEGGVSPGPDDTQAVAMADLNGDGFDDIVACYDDGGSVYVRSFLAMGNGKFDRATPVTYRVDATGMFAASDIAIADMDLDGVLDVVVSYTSPHDVEVYKSDGTFMFPVPAAETEGMSIGDINDDGFPDLATFRVSPPITVNVWINNDGSGVTDVTPNWTVMPFPNTVPLSDPRSVLLTDLNGDDFADLVVGSEFQEAQVYIGDGLGTFVHDIWGEPWPPTGTHELAATDWNQDGHTDLILGNHFDIYGEFSMLWLSDGESSYTQAATTDPFGPDEPNTLGFALIDLNSDGWVDLVEAADDPVLAQSYVKVWLNDGVGGWTAGFSDWFPPGSPVVAAGRLR